MMKRHPAYSPIDSFSETQHEKNGELITFRAGNLNEVKVYDTVLNSCVACMELEKTGELIDYDSSIKIDCLISDNKIKYLGSNDKRKYVSVTLGKDTVYYWKSSGEGQKYITDKDGYLLNRSNQKIKDADGRAINTKFGYSLNPNTKDASKKPVSTAGKWYPFPGFGTKSGEGIPNWIIHDLGYISGYNSQKLKKIGDNIIPEFEERFKQKMEQHDISMNDTLTFKRD